MTSEPEALSWDLIQQARVRLNGRVFRTPVHISRTLNNRLGAQLFFKCENFQKTGAFKARGATNAIYALSDNDARRGIVTHSSGNHAAAVSWAASLRNIPAHIVIPNNAPQAKLASVRRYGGKIVLCDPAMEAREAVTHRIRTETGAVLVHAYNDFLVMAGQATTGIELLEDVPDLDAIVCPIGGGGHLGGIAVAAKTIKSNIRIIGAEPIGADDTATSFREGRIAAVSNPQTIADGLRTTVGSRPFATIQRYVDDIVTVSDESIVSAMRMIWEVMKLVVEASGAVALAAVLNHLRNFEAQRIGIILTGGNLDLDQLPWSTVRGSESLRPLRSAACRHG